MAVVSWDICVEPKNAGQVKTRYGEEHLKLTSIKFNGGLEKPRLGKSGPSPQMPNNLVPIGAVEMVTAVSQNDVIFHTTGHKVVVKGPVYLEKEKEMAKAKDEEKEKEKVKAKEKEEEAGHLDLQR
jgi:hypothetical protein